MLKTQMNVRIVYFKPIYNVLKQELNKVRCLSLMQKVIFLRNKVCIINTSNFTILQLQNEGFEEDSFQFYLFITRFF